MDKGQNAKERFSTVTLGKGEVRVYDFGKIKLHAYKTGDFISDEVFILEKGGCAVIVENPLFFDGVRELTEYVESLKVKTVYKLLAYHLAGGAFLPDAPAYSTAKADGFGRRGGGKDILENFKAAFGEALDSSFPRTTPLKEGAVTLGGIRFNLIATDEAFDIEIPEINAVYIHMLGGDCHSIVPGAKAVDGMVKTLENIVEKGFGLILSSHHEPETLADARAKIAYLKDLKKIAEESIDAETFKKTLSARYPDYKGANYIDMTAAGFFADA